MTPVLNRNAFCILPENFLTSLLFSNEEELRNLAIDTILNVRSREVKLEPVMVPELNLDAPSWDKMVSMSTILETAHNPACLMDMSDADLELMRTLPDSIPPPDFPIHSQSVERCVKLTSSAVKQAYSWERQHQIILATIKSRKSRKKFASKGSYQVQ